MGDLTQFEALDTAWLEVQTKKDDGPLLYNGKPVRIEVRSPGTREALQAQHKADAASQAKAFAAIRGKPQKDSVDDNIEARAARLAAITASIENFPVEALELYRNPRLGYIANQVEKFAGDWGNF